ncbi:MAG TPA: M48 family metalloprotease [Bryobacteraceae bacterium]|nr:M48 family metalloprotease [Bryobacteraceae bacterium]
MKLDNETELAAVLAHAISHIALRHSARFQTRIELLGLAYEGIPLDFVNVGVVMRSMGFRQLASKFERDADVLAAQIMAKAGYDPAGLLSFLRKLPATTGIMFSAFPNPQARIQAVEEAIRLLPAATYRVDDGRFAMWKLAIGTADVL